MLLELKCPPLAQSGGFCTVGAKPTDSAEPSNPSRATSCARNTLILNPESNPQDRREPPQVSPGGPVQQRIAVRQAHQLSLGFVDWFDLVVPERTIAPSRPYEPWQTASIKNQRHEGKYRGKVRTKPNHTGKYRENRSQAGDPRCVPKSIHRAMAILPERWANERQPDVDGGNSKADRCEGNPCH